MRKETYDEIEEFMLECMSDSAHDREHVYRVLYGALDIASYERAPDMDVLITACLLHDIGRAAQNQDPEICHAGHGSEMAFNFLIKGGFEPGFAGHVKECISSHRYRGDNPPVSVEAKILFDSDKLDAAGAMGIARTLLYQGHLSTGLYCVDENNRVLDGTGDMEQSFMREYNFKLKKVYDRFYTRRGYELAMQRRAAAKEFYESLLYEANSTVDRGLELLKNLIN